VPPPDDCRSGLGRSRGNPQMDHIKSLFTRQPTQRPTPHESKSEQGRTTDPDLVALYRQLNGLPQGPKGEDSELRADADSDQIRIKRRTALFTSARNRRVHQVRALALVRAAFGRQLAKYEACVDPDLFNAKREELKKAWNAQAGDGRKPITLRMANCLAMQVLSIMAPDDYRPPEPPYDPGQPVHTREPQRVIWHPRQSELY